MLLPSENHTTNPSLLEKLAGIASSATLVSCGRPGAMYGINMHTVNCYVERRTVDVMRHPFCISLKQLCVQAIESK